MSGVLLTVGLTVACGSPSPSSPSAPPAAASTVLTPVAQSADWPASTPADEGLDPAILGDLVGRIRRGDYGGVDSLLVSDSDILDGIAWSVA